MLFLHKIVMSILSCVSCYVLMTVLLVSVFISSSFFKSL